VFPLGLWGDKIGSCVTSARLIGLGSMNGNVTKLNTRSFHRVTGFIDNGRILS
jgi:hypothetical protein